MDICRRGFFASALTAPLLHGAPNRTGRRVRLGLIGADGHPNEILNPLPDWPDVELVAYAEANSDPKADAAVRKNPAVANTHHYRTADELLARESLDVVAVCNNNGERAAAILAVLAKRIPVIAEKPFATEQGDLIKVVRAAESSKVPVGMLLPMRFDPPYKAMRDIVAAGEIGEVLSIDAQKSYQLDQRPHWQKTARLYGSTILWIGPHMVDLMMWSSGRELEKVSSLESHVRFPEIGDMQNLSVSIFEMDNKGTATLRMDYLRPPSAGGHGDDRLRLGGTRGIVEYQEATGVTVMSGKAPPRRLENLPAAGSVFTDFLGTVFLKKKPALSWREIVRVNEITLKAEEAAGAQGFVATRLLTR